MLKSLKRGPEYVNENEVRVLAYSGFNDNDSRREKDLYNVPISHDQFVDELCIDPRISKEKASFLKRYFYHLGYTGPVVQSDLYTLNITEIRLA